MTVARAVELNRYWSEHPPVDLLVAAYLGVGKSRSVSHTPPMSSEAFVSALAGDGGGGVQTIGFD